MDLKGFHSLTPSGPRWTNGKRFPTLSLSGHPSMVVFLTSFMNFFPRFRISGALNF